MDDELNIDPRETDHADNYDMAAAMNFFALEKEFAKLGYASPELSTRLRDIVRFDHPSYRIQHRERDEQQTRDYFFELYRPKPGEDIVLHHYEVSTLDRDTLSMHSRSFEPDVPKKAADEVLNKQYQLNQEYGHSYHLDQAGLNSYLLNTNTMNDQNLSYLQKQLLNLGFGEKLNDELEKSLKSNKKEFSLNTEQEYNKQSVDYTLHFRAGDDRVFFNSYDASLRDREMQQTFYINKTGAITAKEAYNLLEGRAVHKELENLEGQKYRAWIILDKEHKAENGNFKLRPFTDGWNYRPERTIDKMDIVGIGEEGAREKLMKSLEKGNRHQVTALKEGKEVKLFIEANPADHRLNLTNWKGEAQQLEHYKNPEFKNEQKKDQKQAQAQEDAPAKKQRKGTKMKV